MREILAGLAIITLTLSAFGSILAKVFFDSPLSWLTTLSPIWVPSLFFALLVLFGNIVGTLLKVFSGGFDD